MFDKRVNKIKEVAGQKIDLTDVTFIIPIRISSEDRLINTQITLKYLLKYFNTNIILTENGPESNWDKFGIEKNPNLQYIFQQTNDPIFYRTKILNEMLTMVKTKVTVTYDIDALLPVQSYVTARNAITKQGYSCVTPESGESKRFSIDREHKVILSKTLNLNSLPKNELVPKRGGPARFGLAIFMNTKTYRELGGENENFISWGWEDHDRIMRFRRMKYKVGTLDNTPVKGNSYHLEHERGINSWKISPYYKTNEATLEKTKRFLNQRRRENIPIEEVAKLCIRRPGNQP